MYSKPAVAFKKQELRDQLLSMRRDRSVGNIETAGQRIAQRLFQLNSVQKSRWIGMYAADEHEVSTRPIFEEALHHGIKVAFPRVDSKSLRFFAISDWKHLQPGFSKILEPVWGIEVAPSRLDVLLVPAVGFDHHRGRLGRGGGYYDRLLSDLVNRPRLVIGIGYDFQVTTGLPTTTHDIRMDLIVTEERVI